MPKTMMITDRARIGIMICSAKRPQMLLDCLHSLIRQESDPAWQVEICVIENDQTPHSQAAILDLAEHSPFAIHYAQEPRRGIPFARNKALEEAVSRSYDWIGFVDDDQIIRPGFLHAHMRAIAKYQADVSQGAVIYHYEKQPPAWWPPVQLSTKPAGEPLKRAATGNVFFSAALAGAPAHLRFNTLFLYGYEDLDFFERANQQGFKIIWTPDAVVEEVVPVSRVEPGRLIGWVQSSAAAHVQAGIIRKGYAHSAIKFGLKGVRRLIGGGLMIAFLFIPKSLGWRKAVHAYYKSRLRFSRGLGNLQGVLRRPANYYNQIDGH